MKLILSSLAAALLLTATVAQARPPPRTATDKARGPSGDAPVEIVVAASPVPSPRTTDEVRALAHASLPGAAPSALVVTRPPATTDEARALAGGAVLVPVPATPVKADVACHRPCGCDHG